MNNILKQIDSFVIKQKVTNIEKYKKYLRSGERPSQGQQVMRGGRGSYWYETGRPTSQDRFVPPSYKQRKAYRNIFRREPDSSWSSGDIGLRIRQGLNQMKERRKFKGG